MQLQLESTSADSLQAGYRCTCGCKPSVTVDRGAPPAEDMCCCGTHFVVGPDAESRLDLREGFRVEVQEFDAPWGQVLEAAWAVGSGQHQH